MSPKVVTHFDFQAERAVEAPIIRNMFSSSPRDPRYHMLSYISQKFSKPCQKITHEPRAALFLNRFSRTLTIMYATNGLMDIMGISADELCGKSFYYCIQENCLRDAVKCLESAKANDSIAYLRFWFRDPRQDNRVDRDEHMSDGHSSGDEDEGGVHINELMDHDGSENALYSDSSYSMGSSMERDQSRNLSFDPNSRSSSGNSTDIGANTAEAIFDRPVGAQQSRDSSVSTPDEQPTNAWEPALSHIELEAVVSCTSDGLVVVLRQAQPFVAHISHPAHQGAQHPYVNGYFASPWASEPILPTGTNRTQLTLPNLQQPPQAPRHPTAAGADMAATKGPPAEDFMNCIREVAVFAWALTGINGSLEQYGRGTPSGESQPPGGMPVWDPSSSAGPEADRPLGGAYWTEHQGYVSTPQKRIGNRGDTDCAYGYPLAPDETGNWASNTATESSYLQNRQSQIHRSPDHSSKNVHPVENHTNDILMNGMDNGTRTSSYNHHEQANDYYQNNSPWTQQPEHERRWDTSHHPDPRINGHGGHDYRRRIG